MNGDDSQVRPVVELTHEDLATIAQAWPEELREALARWLARACTAAGITDQAQRITLQRQFYLLTGTPPD